MNGAPVAPAPTTTNTRAIMTCGATVGFPYSNIGDEYLLVRTVPAGTPHLVTLPAGGPRTLDQVITAIQGDLQN